MRFLRWSLIWVCVGYFVVSIMVGTLARHYRVGLDLAEIRCLPWRVYIVEFDREAPAALGSYVAFVPRNGLMGKSFEGRLVGKQVAGVAGDRVVVKNDFAWVNGRPVGQLILNAKLGKGPGSFDRDETVPAGKVFVVGTEPRSYDGRYWGFVDKHDIVGTVRPLI